MSSPKRSDVELTDVARIALDAADEEINNIIRAQAEEIIEVTLCSRSRCRTIAVPVDHALGHAISALLLDNCEERRQRLRARFLRVLQDEGKDAGVLLGRQEA